MPRALPEWQVSTAQTAKELSLNPSTVIWLMERHKLPIGKVVRREGAAHCKTIISRKLLDEYKERMGIT